jgi:hypothetical protein
VFVNRPGGLTPNKKANKQKTIQPKNKRKTQYSKTNQTTGNPTAEGGADFDSNCHGVPH